MLPQTGPQSPPTPESALRDPPDHRRRDGDRPAAPGRDRLCPAPRRPAAEAADPRPDRGDPGRHLGRRRAGPAGRHRVESGPRGHGSSARVRESRRARRSRRSRNALAGVYQVRGIIRSALLEGASFFLMVSYLIGGPAWELILGVVLAGGVAVGFPTRDGIEGWIEPGSTKARAGHACLRPGRRSPLDRLTRAGRRRPCAADERQPGAGLRGLAGGRGAAAGADGTGELEAPGMNSSLNVGATAWPVTRITRSWPSASRIRSLTPGMCQASRP